MMKKFSAKPVLRVNETPPMSGTPASRSTGNRQRQKWSRDTVAENEKSSISPAPGKEHRFPADVLSAESVCLSSSVDSCRPVLSRILRCGHFHFALSRASRLFLSFGHFSMLPAWEAGHRHGPEMHIITHISIRVLRALI